MINILVEPPGVITETSSPTCFPRSALPTGDSSEMRPLLGSASADPTMVKASSPYSSCTLTVDPTSTMPLTCLPSMMLAFRTSFSRRRTRPSTKPCSFLASSYSAFSLMSPNSLACRIRSATSGRRLLRRTSSSAWSRFNPSCVRYTTLSFSIVLPSRNRLAAPRAAVLYGIPPASSLAQNLNREGRQILADPGFCAHGQDDPEEAVERIAPGGQLARGGPIGGKRGGGPRGPPLVGGNPGQYHRHRPLPHPPAPGIPPPDIEPPLPTPLRSGPAR